MHLFSVFPGLCQIFVMLFWLNLEIQPNPYGVLILHYFHRFISFWILNLI